VPCHADVYPEGELPLPKGARVLTIWIAANLAPPPEAVKRIRTGMLPMRGVIEDERDGNEGMNDRLGACSRA